MEVVVLVSGGMDSTTLLHYVCKRLPEVGGVYALSVAYGQRHDRELEMARWQCAQLPEVKDWRTVDLPAYTELTAGASALTDLSVPVPDLAALDATELSQPITYVPNRNMVLLSLAAAYAETRGCDRVYYGAQAQDEYGYWDCSATFVERLNAVLALNHRTPVRIEAPFVGWRKADELRLGFELGVDYSRTWTCYRGGEFACGVCPSCAERRKAFAEVDLPDPMDYEKELS